MRIRSLIGIFGLLLAITLLNNQSTFAQSTIFNIPTTDIVPKKKLYLEFDLLVQAPKEDDFTDEEGDFIEPGRIVSYIPRGVVGVGKNVEVGVNFSFFHQGESKVEGIEVEGATQAYMSPNIKWRFYNNEEAGVASSVGGLLYVPLNNRDDRDGGAIVNRTFGFLYTNLSKKVKHDFGPRFTVGAYGIAGAKDGQFSGPRAGAILGYEQPVHSKVSIVADWISGKNGFGYFTPGVSFTLPSSSLLNVGYSIGNNSFSSDSDDYVRSNKYLFVYFGKTF
jgi:hypothetical protein